MPDMKVYRIYLIGTQAGIAMPDRSVLCGDDDEMLDVASKMMKGAAKAAVWQGLRHVGEVSSWTITKTRPGDAAPGGLPPSDAIVDLPPASPAPAKSGAPIRDDQPTFALADWIVASDLFPIMCSTPCGKSACRCRTLIRCIEARTYTLEAT